MAESTIILKLRQWWKTECKYCKRARLILLWFILMLIVDYYWFHLLF